jgi:DNA-binding PadR family transcriptional regulator
VLSLLATEPRRALDVARALSGAGPGAAVDYQVALMTLDRLRDGGLVRRRAAEAGPLYEITRRGRAELRLQRLIWARLIAT